MTEDVVVVYIFIVLIVVYHLYDVMLSILALIFLADRISKVRMKVSRLTCSILFLVVYASLQMVPFLPPGVFVPVIYLYLLVYNCADFPATDSEPEGARDPWVIGLGVNKETDNWVRDSPDRQSPSRRLIGLRDSPRTRNAP